jgi:hypothetical protein
VTSAQLVLDAEFTDAASARQVLTAIGSEAVTRPGFNDVLWAISDPGERGAAQTAVTRALKILEGPKDLIRIEVPSGAAANSRLRRYRLTDPYLRFWFRFIAGHLEDISRSSLEVDIACTAANIATVGTVKWRPRGGVTRTEMAELGNARNVVPHAGGARLLAVCPSGLAPGASADIVLRPEDLLAAWGV